MSVFLKHAKVFTFTQDILQSSGKALNFISVALPLLIMSLMKPTKLIQSCQETKQGNLIFEFFQISREPRGLGESMHNCAGKCFFVKAVFLTLSWLDCSSALMAVF